MFPLERPYTMVAGCPCRKGPPAGIMPVFGIARFFRRISRDLPTRGKARPVRIESHHTPPATRARAVVGSRESDVTESLIDLRALLVEREDFEGGMVGKLREGLAQGGPQIRSLKDILDTLTKRLAVA